MYDFFFFFLRKNYVGITGLHAEKVGKNFPFQVVSSKLKNAVSTHLLQAAFSAF